MCTFDNVDKEFDEILREVDKDTYLNDLGKAAPSAVRPSTTERQVLVTLAVTEGRYGALQIG